MSMAVAHAPRISIIPRPHKIQPSTRNTGILSYPKPHEVLIRSLSTPSISLKPKQTNDHKRHMKNSIDTPITVRSESNNADKVSKSEKVSQTKVIEITLGVIALAALGGLAIGLYTVIQNSKTTATTTTAASSELAWSSTGVTVAGTGSWGSQITQLLNPWHIVIDSSDAIYIADSGNHRISKWVSGSATGTIVAGQINQPAGSGVAYLSGPYGVCIDSNRNVYVADRSNHRVQLWNNSASSGVTVAGTGTSGSSTNQLTNPASVTLNKNADTLYIADTDNNRIVAVTLATTVPTVVAGGGAFPMAQLTSPADVYFDSSTNSLYIANSGAHTIVRWVIGASSWTLIAGTPGYSQPTPLSLNNPQGLTFDSAGNMYVSDTGYHRIQFFSAGNTTGKTIVGTTSTTGTGSSFLNSPRSVVLDSQFNIYVSDTSNYRIQKFQRI